MASWGGGKLEGCAISPGAINDIEVEIGPQTANGRSVVFSTDGSGALKDKSGRQIFFSNGVIEVKKLFLKAPGAGQVSELIARGSNPLIIRCSESCVIEEGARVTASGSSSDIAVTCNGALAFAGGAGNCGGGNGGIGSPRNDRSSEKGNDGESAFNLTHEGGRGGHSGYWTDMPLDFWKDACNKKFQLEMNTRPGGGGGGNWGVFEWLGNGYGTICYSPAASPCKMNFPAYCVYPLNDCPAESQVNSDCAGVPPNNTHGEPGALGVDTATDVLTGANGPLGGDPGPAIFVDGDPSNDFFGRKPFNDSVIQGELTAVLGGQGGGAGGDCILYPVFPNPFYSSADLSGGPGGGGGGVIWIQSLGPLIIQGRVEANGGKGGRGEIIVEDDSGAGGGGGGAGGMILLESATQIRIGMNAVIEARGGNRGIGGGLMTNPPEFPGGCNSFPSRCLKNCSALRGGAGGKGIIQLHVPFDTSGPRISCDEIGSENDLAIRAGALQVETSNGFADISCERDPTLTGFSPKHFDPPPHLLITHFGAQSAARSQWHYTGFSELIGTLDYEFQGLDVQGYLDEGSSLTLASGNDLSVLDTNSVSIQSAGLLESVRSEPRILSGDLFTAGEQSFHVLDASISGDKLNLFLDRSTASLQGNETWSLRRRCFLPLINGVEANYTPTVGVKIQFEGADESFPGNKNPINVVGPTSNLSLLRGKKMVRFTVEFNRDRSGLSLGPNLPNPGLGRIKIPYSF